MVIPGTGGTSTVAWTTKPGEMTPKQRAEDKAKHRWVEPGGKGSANESRFSFFGGGRCWNSR